MPPPQAEEAFDPDRESSDFVRTVTTFEKDDDIGLIREFLRTHKTTGQLVVHMNQGGTTRLELVEQSPLSVFQFNERSAGEDPNDEDEEVS